MTELSKEEVELLLQMQQADQQASLLSDDDVQMLMQMDRERSTMTLEQQADLMGQLPPATRQHFEGLQRQAAQSGTFSPTGMPSAAAVTGTEVGGLNPEQNSLLRALAERNVDVTTGLSDTRLRQGTQFAANKIYASEFLRQQGLESIVDEKLGVLWREQGQKIWHPIDEVGFTGNDIIDGANELVQVGPEAILGGLGALGGAIASGAAAPTTGGGSLLAAMPLSMAGATMGTALGAQIGERGRHAVAEWLGVPEPTNIDQRASSAAWTAALWGLGADLTLGAAMAVRAMISPAHFAYDAVRIQRLLEMGETKSIREMQDEVNKTLERAGREERLWLTPGQLSNDVHQLGREGDALKGAFGKALEERHVHNKTALEAYLDVITPRPADTALRNNAVAAQRSSREVMTALRDHHQRSVNLQQRNLDEITRDGQRWVSEFDYLDEAAIGGEARGLLAVAREQMKDIEDAAFRAARDKAGYNELTGSTDFSIPWTAELSEVITRLNAESRTSLFSGDAAGKQQLTKNLKPHTDIYLVNTKGDVVSKLQFGDDIDLDALMRGTRYLNRLKREKSAGRVGFTPAERDINNVEIALRKAAMQQLDLMARNGDARAGEVADLLRTAYQQTRRRNELFDEGVVGEVLAREGNNYVVSRPEAMRSLLLSADKDSLNQLYTILYRMEPRGLQAMRRLVYSTYRREVAPEGTPDLKLHNKFMANHGQLIDQFFPQNASRIRGELGTFPEAIARQERELLRLEDTINKLTGDKLVRVQTIGGERRVVDSINARSLHQMAMKGQLSPDQIDGIKNALITNEFGQGVYAEWRRMVGNTIHNHILKGQGPVISVTKIESLTNGPGAETIAEMFGMRYIRNLEILTEMVRRNRRVSGVSASGNFGAQLINAWLRPVFRPLSTRGLIRTAALTTRQRSIERAAAEIISDPQKLQRFLNARHLKPSDQRVANVLTAMGATQLIDLPVYPPSPATEE